MPRPEGPRYYYRGSTMRLTVSGAAIDTTGADLGNAPSTVDIVDQEGAPLAAPIDGTYDGTENEYTFILPGTLPVEKGDRIVGRVRLDGGPGLQYGDEFEIIVR